jgi:hypothetical protein
MPEIGTERVGGRGPSSFSADNRDQGRPSKSEDLGPRARARTDDLVGRAAATQPGAKPNELGLLIHSEVDRAESRLDVIRGRAQFVLTASGVLVTLLAGVNRQSGTRRLGSRTSR